MLPLFRLPQKWLIECVFLHVIVYRERQNEYLWPLHFISFQLRRPTCKNILIFLLLLALEMLVITRLVIIWLAIMSNGEAEYSFSFWYIFL